MQRRAGKRDEDIYSKIHTNLFATCLCLCLFGKPKKEYSPYSIACPTSIWLLVFAMTPSGSAPRLSELYVISSHKARQQASPRHFLPKERDARGTHSGPLQIRPTRNGTKQQRQGETHRSAPVTPLACGDPRPVPPARRRLCPRLPMGQCRRASYAASRCPRPQAATVPAKFSDRRVLIALATRGWWFAGARGPKGTWRSGGKGRRDTGEEVTYTTSLEMIHDTMAGRRAGGRGPDSWAAGGAALPTRLSVRAPPPPPD